MGKELEVYGPFKAGEHALLPLDIAQVLIRKGDATLTGEESRAHVEQEMDTQPQSVTDPPLMAQE